MYRKLSTSLILMLSIIINYNVIAQDKIIQGIVTTFDSIPLIGVQIKVKSTKQEIRTDTAGTFSIACKAKDILTVSADGFYNQKVRLTEKTKFVAVNLNLKPGDKNRFLAIGYGQQNEENVVGAISQLSTDDIMSSKSGNMTQAISGKIAGVITSQSSGIPGADNAEIYIRGRATWAGDGQPLVLVDGVERDFSQIASDDIQSITVLKDALSTAVYGIRGANGVILITTKRGRD
ncbi:MAG TPA: TonB-dependent receptor plug domain-containing protein [Draconibacterium sp.]|nr:TonB-dependent receptor plug domain-containing protein [Draconibacterium sp.]